jgi:hypothetical protein
VKHGPARFTGPIGGTINGTSYSGSATTQGVPLVNDPNPSIEAPELGLEHGWQQRVVAAVGSYEAIRRRNLGTPLKLPAGANAHWRAGGALMAPLAE